MPHACRYTADRHCPYADRLSDRDQRRGEVVEPLSFDTQPRATSGPRAVQLSETEAMDWVMKEYLGPLQQYDKRVCTKRARTKRQNPYIEEDNPLSHLAERGEHWHGVKAFETDFDWTLALDAGAQ